MTAETVLVVEDEPDIAELLQYVLAQEGFRVEAAHDGRTALERARRLQPSLVVLDLMLPEMSGMEVLKGIRGAPETRGARVILLTAKTDELDRVLGFELGADDYVTKPFSPRELVLRAKAVLKRGIEPEPLEGARIRSGPIEVDLENHVALIQGKALRLTLTEFRLLADLVRARGRVRSREALLAEVWGYDAEVLSRTVDTHVRRLRHKLGPAAAWLVTVRGVGYRVQDPAAER
jgi:two-component system phosphate regulon response regulator PhoB